MNSLVGYVISMHSHFPVIISWDSVPFFDEDVVSIGQIIFSGTNQVESVTGILCELNFISV